VALKKRRKRKRLGRGRVLVIGGASTGLRENTFARALALLGPVEKKPIINTRKTQGKWESF